MSTTDTTIAEARVAADNMREAFPAELTCVTLDVPLKHAEGGRHAEGRLVAYTSPSFPGLAVTCIPALDRKDGRVYRWDVTHLPTGLAVLRCWDRFDVVLAIAVGLAKLTDWSTITPENTAERIPPIAAGITRVEDDARRLIGEYVCEECDLRLWDDEDRGLMLPPAVHAVAEAV